MTTDEMLAAKNKAIRDLMQYARIQAYDAKQIGDLKKESYWLETAAFWHAILEYDNKVGIPL